MEPVSRTELSAKTFSRCKRGHLACPSCQAQTLAWGPGRPPGARPGRPRTADRAPVAGEGDGTSGVRRSHSGLSTGIQLETKGLPRPYPIASRIRFARLRADRRLHCHPRAEVRISERSHPRSSARCTCPPPRAAQTRTGRAGRDAPSPLESPGVLRDSQKPLPPGADLHRPFDLRPALLPGERLKAWNLPRRIRLRTCGGSPDVARPSSRGASARMAPSAVASRESGAVRPEPSPGGGSKGSSTGEPAPKAVQPDANKIANRCQPDRPYPVKSERSGAGRRGHD